MGMRTYELEFIVTYHKRVTVASEAEAQAILDAASVVDTYDEDAWEVDPYEHEKTITDSWDEDPDEDDKDGEEQTAAAACTTCGGAGFVYLRPGPTQPYTCPACGGQKVVAAASA